MTCYDCKDENNLGKCTHGDPTEIEHNEPEEFDHIDAEPDFEADDIAEELDAREDYLEWRSYGDDYDF